MPFTVFATGDTISSSEFNDNYYHYGQDDLLPRGGVSLEATTSVYDLGSGTYRWKSIYANNLTIIGSLTGSWQRISTVDVSTPVSRIELFGLNGDVDDHYMILADFEFSSPAADTYLLMSLNSNSEIAYYSRGYVVDALAVSVFNYTGSGIYVANIGTIETGTAVIHSRISLFSKTGYNKMAVLETGELQGSTNGSQYIHRKFGAVMNTTTSDTLTTIQFYCDTTTGEFTRGHVEIWAKR